MNYFTYTIHRITSYNVCYTKLLRRLGQLQKYANFCHAEFDMADRDQTAELFAQEQFDAVVNLAAQAGVRYSLINPHSYVDTNLVGFVNILEGCRHTGVRHLVYASSSSVYGANTKMPFSVHDNVVITSYSIHYTKLYEDMAKKLSALGARVEKIRE